MNVIQISDGYVKIPPEKGGPIESVIFNISKKMVEQGHKVTIFERKQSEKDSIEEYIDGIKIIRLNTRKIDNKSGLISIALSSIDFAFKFNEYIRKTKFDVIHVHLPLSALFLIYINKGIKSKLIYTFHGDAYRLNLNDKFKLPLYLKFFSPDLHLMNKTKILVVLNNSLRDKLIAYKKFKCKNIFVVNNGVDIDIFNTKTDIFDIRNRYLINNKIVILFVGGLTQRKGIDYIIKSAEILIQKLKYRNIIFLLVGPIKEYGMGGSQSSSYYLHITKLITDFKLEEFVRITDIISFNDLKKLYVASDIFILPSIEEGFGLVLTEAMASGKPVIGTNVGGISMQIENNCNGFLIEPANEKQLAEKIKYLIDNPEERVRMGENSRKIAENKFNWEKIAENYLSIYEYLINS